jgi:hypothetical protein
LAVLAGIATLTVASFAIEAVVDPVLLRLFPSALPNAAAIAYNLPAMLLQFSYTALSIAAGGSVTAWLARRARLRHAIIMGAVEVVLTVLAMMSFADKAPLRMWIVSMVMTIPAAWVGGVLAAQVHHKKDQATAAASGLNS